MHLRTSSSSGSSSGGTALSFLLFAQSAITLAAPVVAK